MMPPALSPLADEPSVVGGAGVPLSGRELRGVEEFRAAAALYSRVFGYESPEFALNLNLLSALTQNGGSAVGVFTSAGELIGFAYGFAGRDVSGREFHYSQAATVDPRYQGLGVGRTLKHLQARVAERWGHRSMRWTFDPLLARNAHFNFTSLGATGIEFLPDYYARPGTDRILVEWVLDAQERDRACAHRRASGSAQRPPTLTENDWGLVRADGDAIWVAVPATAPEPWAAVELRARLGDSLRETISSGHQLIACVRVSEHTSAYLAVSDNRKESS
ncbi:GNAT family N-acetyltransferase [Leucobacter sp. M11]|uniref:GNAT family N-acetyltransferase n=1 Tax=Leucobacter sp. M11 TaxID=2993565 RepID=UPI002D80BE68|nr:GNAT family N-acetyltransferase [Leucobacter sp. M11]MEB4613172.1 GNAT family N-acetyltransferase [Leucobacter sp. M11]